MRTIYNSGKFTGILPEEEAYKKFEKYTQMLEEKGYCVIDPTLLVPKGTSYDDAMHICLNAVGYGEAIFMQPDWMQSEGACKELMEAQKKGKRIYWNIEEVPALSGSPAFLNHAILSNEDIVKINELFGGSTFALASEPLVKDKLKVRSILEDLKKSTSTPQSILEKEIKDTFSAFAAVKERGRAGKVDEQPQEHKLELCYNNCCFIYRNVRFTVDHGVAVSTADFYPQFKYSVNQRSKERLYFPTHEEALRAKAEIEALQELAKKQIAEEATTNSVNN